MENFIKAFALSLVASHSFFAQAAENTDQQDINPLNLVQNQYDHLSPKEKKDAAEKLWQQNTLDSNTEAVKLFQGLYDQGQETRAAAYRLGTALQAGRGTKKDLETAYTYFTFVQDRSSLYCRGLIYADKSFSQYNLELALKDLKESLQLGIVAAQPHIERITRLLEEPSQSQTLNSSILGSSALSISSISHDLGTSTNPTVLSSIEIVKLAEKLWQQNTIESNSEAVKLFQDLYDQKQEIRAAAYRLGTAFYLGRGITKDIQTAYDYFSHVSLVKDRSSLYYQGLILAESSFPQYNLELALENLEASHALQMPNVQPHIERITRLWAAEKEAAEKEAQRITDEKKVAKKKANNFINKLHQIHNDNSPFDDEKLTPELKAVQEAIVKTAKELECLYATKKGNEEDIQLHYKQLDMLLDEKGNLEYFAFMAYFRNMDIEERKGRHKRHRLKTGLSFFDYLGQIRSCEMLLEPGWNGTTDNPIPGEEESEASWFRKIEGSFDNNTKTEKAVLKTIHLDPILDDNTLDPIGFKIETLHYKCTVSTASIGKISSNIEQYRKDGYEIWALPGILENLTPCRYFFAIPSDPILPVISLTLKDYDMLYSKPLIKHIEEAKQETKKIFWESVSTARRQILADIPPLTFIPKSQDPEGWRARTHGFFSRDNLPQPVITEALVVVKPVISAKTLHFPSMTANEENKTNAVIAPIPEIIPKSSLDWPRIWDEGQRVANKRVDLGVLETDPMTVTIIRHLSRTESVSDFETLTNDWVTAFSSDVKDFVSFIGLSLDQEDPTINTGRILKAAITTNPKIMKIIDTMAYDVASDKRTSIIEAVKGFVTAKKQANISEGKQEDAGIEALYANDVFKQLNTIDGNQIGLIADAAQKLITSPTNQKTMCDIIKGLQSPSR